LKRKIEAILFDFDGTLANTLPLIFDSFRGLFREFKNQEITPAEVESMFGPTEIGIIKKQFKEKIPEVIEKFYKTYEEKHIDFQHKEEEFIDLLEFIKSKGLKIGIVTGKGRDTLNISLRLLKMDKYFDVLISGDDVQDPKPSPEGIYKALEKINVLPEKTLFVGDSDADIGAGKSARVLYSIGVDWVSDFVKIKLKPDFFFSCVKDFKMFVEKLLSIPN